MKRKYFVIETDNGEHFAVIHLKEGESEERFIDRICEALHEYADQIMETGDRVRTDTVVLHTSEQGDIRVEFRWKNYHERETFWLVQTTLF